MTKNPASLTTKFSSVARRLLAELYDWLDCSEAFSNSDLIFVHAGAKQRKVVALELYVAGKARGLLLSMTPREARNFAMLTWPVPAESVQAAFSNPAVDQHAFVYLESGGVTVEHAPLGILGTWGEVRQLAHWLTKHTGVTSLVIVSSAPHLRRVRLCCRALLPANISTRLFAVPPYGYWDRNRWWLLPRTCRAVLFELPKLFLYLPMAWLRRRRNQPF